MPVDAKNFEHSFKKLKNPKLRNDVWIKTGYHRHSFKSFHLGHHLNVFRAAGQTKRVTQMGLLQTFLVYLIPRADGEILD